jgi:prefoldin subunit 5
MQNQTQNLNKNNTQSNIDRPDILNTILSTVQRISEQLIELKEEVNDLKERVTRLEERMDRLEELMDRLEGRMDRLEERMDRLEERMDRLEGRMDRLEERVQVLENSSNRNGDWSNLSSSFIRSDREHQENRRRALQHLRRSDDQAKPLLNPLRNMPDAPGTLTPQENPSIVNAANIFLDVNRDLQANRDVLLDDEALPVNPDDAQVLPNLLEGRAKVSLEIFVVTRPAALPPDTNNNFGPVFMKPQGHSRKKLKEDQKDRNDEPEQMAKRNFPPTSSTVRSIPNVSGCWFRAASAALTRCPNRTGCWSPADRAGFLPF